jgi:tetratricopeptide (TPR) repeat protein
MLPPASATSMQLRFDAHLTSGTFLSQQGSYEKAVEEFRQAVDIFPKSVEAHVYLGLGLLQANKKPEGIAEIRAAKALDAKQANEILTKALHLQVDERNLDGFIEQAMR